MPDFKYLVRFSDSSTAYVSAEDFEKKKDELFRVDPKAQVSKVGDFGQGSTVKDWESYQVDFPDGSSRVVDAQTFNAKRDVLGRIDGVRVSTISPVKFQNGKMYDVDSAIEAERKFKEFNSKNWDFMQNFEDQQSAARKEDPTEVYGFRSSANRYVEQNQGAYTVLKNERDKVLTEYWDNPFIKERAEEKKEQARGLEDEYIQNKKDAGFLSSDRRTWKRAAAYQRKIADIYEAPNKYITDDASNGFVKFFKQGRAGAHDVMGSQDFWTMGLTEITRNVDTYKIYNKYTEAAKKAEEEGRSLTEAEINSLFSEADKAELVGFLQYADAQKERAYTLTGAYEAGRGFAESIPYMVEFMVSQGGASAAGKAMQASNKAFVRWLGKALMSEKQISKLVKASDEAVAAGKQATYAATNYAKLGKLAKVAERADNALVKPIVQGVWHTATQPLALNKAVTERMVQMDDNGQMQGYWQSFFDELPDQLIENWSESVGGALEELMALPFKGVGSIGEATIGGTGFGRWARWMHNSAGITTLREAGFNGLIGEMAEEWAGNAVRLATGRMTTEEFKDFASLKQQLQMAASFAPMSLIGLGTGAIGAYQYSKKYQGLSNQAKEVLRRLGKSEDEINDIFNTRFDTPEDVATKLVPYAIEAGNQKENAQAVKDYATMLEFSRALGMKQVGEMIREEEDRQDRQTMRDAITATTGIDNWYQTHESEAKDKDGNPIVVEEVRVIQDSEGKTYYVLNEDASGEVVTRDEFGNTRYFSPTEMEDGTVVSDRQMMLDDYLKERSDSSKADAERQRMDETARGKLNQIKQALSQNPVINVGTAEAPNNVRFVEEAPGGARFADEAGNVYNLSWAAIGQQLGVDMSVKTDAEMQQEAVKEYDEMRDRVDTYNKMTPGTKLTVSLEGAEPFEGEFVKAVVEDGTVLLYIDDGNGARAYAEDSVANLPEKSIDAMQEVVETPPASGEQMVYTNPAGQRSRVTMVEERPESGTAVVRTEDGIETAVPSSSLSRESTSVVDNTPRDYKGNPLPLNDDGSVDEAALWDNDPKAWAVWNTDQRGDGGENSAKYIAKAIERESAELESLRNEYDNEPDFNRRKELEENIRAHQERAGVLGSVAEEIVNGQMPYQAAAAPISSSAPSSEVAPAPQLAAPVSSQAAAAQPAPTDQEAARMQNKERLVKKAYREAKRALAKTDRQLRNATPEQRDQIMRERELILQRYLDKIKSSDVTVITYADAAESLRLAGEREDVAVSVAKELDNARKFGWKVRGFFNGSAKKPRIYILADGISSVDECRITYVHERQHGFTMEAGYVDDVLAMDGVDRESLVEWVRNLSGTNSYDGKPDSVLADEAISMAMEVAYNSTPETLEENLRARGVDNAEFINFVKTLDNEQRNDPSISLAYISEREDAVVLGRDRQEDGGQDVRDSVSQPGVLGDELGEQQYGPARSGRRGTEGGAGTVESPLFSVTDGYAIPQDRVSENLDQNNRPFILNSRGGEDFGVITAEQNLPAAPIKLSLGDAENGLIHIEQRHGAEIRAAGYNDVLSFVEDVAENFTDIREGSSFENSQGGQNQSYILQVTDEHNNTLFVQLSRNGQYWNINSAGVFSKKYGKNKKSIWSASSQQIGSSATPDSALQSEPNTDDGSTSKGTAPNVSIGKDSEISGETNTSEQNMAEQRLSDGGIASNGDEVRFSVRYVPTEEERSGVIDDIVESTGVEREKAEQWLQSETSLAAIILSEDNAPFLDYKGDDNYTAIKQDSDYPQGTVDFNNICRKRLPFTEMYQRVQRAFPNVVITGEDLAKIRTIMKNHGITVACGLCYVEDRRQLLGEIAREFINEVQTDFKGYVAKGGETKKKNADKFRRMLGEDTKEDLSIYDLITLDGAAKLREEHPGVYAAFQAFNSARGQQAGNLFQGYAEYKREILKWNKKKVASVNANGGLRVFSYSDFEAHHLIDLVQIIQDCARKGVKIQGYTKVPAFARAIANTGAKINRSLIPLGDTGIVDGRLAYDPVEGIDINDPDFIESNDNIGNILIGINDEQIRLAMADPFIHFIIPYHSNQSGVLRTLKQTGAWTNYKTSQNEKGADGKVAEHVNIYTDVLDRAEKEGHPITNEREFTEEFLAVCKERGLTPRFSQFLYTDENGEFIYTPGYYKFLVDFKLFDEEGRILPQQPVVPEFDDELNKRILDDYVSGEREKLGENYDSVYDEIVDELALNGRNVAAQFGLDAPKKPSSKKAAGKKKSGGLRMSVFRGAEQALESDGISIDDQALMDEYGLSNVTMSKKGDVVKLDKIVAKEMNQGNGTRFMTDLATVADRHGWTLSLTPDASFGASSISRLKKFYKRFGFKDNKGRNTDFTINESMVRRPESDGDNEIRWSFAGRQGAFKLDEANGGTVRMDNLGIAESMEEAGNDAKSIKMATGWERGADGKWRYEIGSAALKDGVFNIIRNTRASGIRPVLNDILEPGSEVLQAYPDLKYVNVTANNVRGEYGSANRPKNTINLSEGEIIKASDPVRTLKETINHEIQHFIQGYEGFAVGANSSLNPKNSESLAKAQAENPTLFNFLNFFGGANSFAKLARSSADKCKESISRAVAANNFTGELLDRAKQLYRDLGKMDAYEYTSIVKQAKSLMTKARKEAQYNYDHSAGEVEARNVSRRLRLSDDQKANTLASETEDIAREEQVVRFSKVTDRDLIARLDSEPKIRVYRSAQFIPDPNGNVDFDLGDGKGLQKGFLYAPMSAKVDGKWRDPISIGEWEQADENPELANDNGEFVLDKGNGDKLTVAYAPYLHTRRSPLNEQFSGAYERGNLVILESEIPESELTSGYTAEKSKKSTGEHDWPSGKVSNALAKEGMDTRKVILSRWAKPIRVVPNSEVADMISELIGDRKLSFPYNVVTPGLRRELQSRGVKFSGWQGNKPKNVNEIIAGIKEESGEDVRFSITPEQDREYMDAVESGDMETAQRLVDQAARFAFPNSTVKDANGNLLPVYHDTNSKRYVNRETGQDWESLDWKERDAWEQRDDWDQHWEERDFYTFDRRNARTSIEMPAFFFATEEDPYHEYGERTIKAYINLTNPVVDPVIENAGVTNTAGADAMQKYIDEGYDGFVRIDEDGKPYEYGVFDANNIKSAEPVTYDDNGDVIPLSERFNPERDDIRFSRVYHGTGADFDHFDHSHMGEGEGSQVYGYGTYVTTNKDTGEIYANIASSPKVTYSGKKAPTYYAEELVDFIADGIGKGKSFEDERGEVVSMLERSGKENKEGKYGDYWKNTTNEKEIDFIKSLKESDFDLRKGGGRHLYTVEIPDDNGENYIHWDEPITQEQSRKIMDAVLDRVGDEWGEELDYELKSSLGYGTYGSQVESGLNYFLGDEKNYATGDDPGARRNAQLLNSIGIVGIEIPVDRRGGKRYEGSNYVIFNEDDLQITDHIRFSKANQSQNVFISNAEAALDGIQQQKATPEQWLKMLEGKGGLKAGEDKWLGLSDWIREQDKKSLTKKEIADYIAENRIQIEEVRYGDNEALRDAKMEEFSAEFKEEYDKTPDSISSEERAQSAFDSMVEKYGEDFTLAFDYESDPEGYHLIPQFDYDEEPTDAAKYFLGDYNGINQIRLDYTTEGLDNKREIALTVPTIEPWNEDDRIHFGDAGEGRAVAWIRFGDATVSRAKNAAEAAYREAEKAWLDYRNEIVNKYALRATGTKTTKDLATPEENARVHELRMESVRLYHEWRYGGHPKEKVLVIDEIQSKRHQEGREEGYVDGANIEALEKKWRDASDAYDEYIDSLYDKYGGLAGVQRNITEEENKHAEELNDASIEAANAVDKAKGGIPDAPFEKNWHELAMKRMLRLAAEEGYDYVAWTTGEQQAERYNLGGAVDSIEINDKEGGLRDVTVKMKDAPDMGFDVSSDGHVVAATDPAFVGNKMLSDYLGKDLANRVMSAETGQSIDGDGLRIGGDGMKGFYDDILPRFMNKYGKKWGVKVDDMFINGIGEGNTNGLTMHAVPVNEAMKESVMEGQVMFSVADGIGEISDVALKHEQLQSAPVTPITKGILSTRDDRPALQRALGWYKNNIKTAQVYDTDKGEIIIDSQSIRSTMAHKYGPEKLDAITSLFDGFNNAVYITDMVDFENDAITYSYFVYPAEYDGERVYCLCRTKITKDEGAKNRLYIHEVFSDKQIKNSTLQAAADGSHQVRGKVLYLNLLKQVVDYKGSNNSDNSKENKENSANPPLFSIQSRRAAVESVEKEGLGGIIGPENVAPLMRGIYTSLPREIRGRIVDDSMADWFNARKAFNTYLHDLAFNGTENDDTGLLFMLYDEIRDESGNYDLTNNDIRYMLWKATSDSRNGDLLALASEQAMKNRWGVASEDEEVRFSARKEFGESAEESKEKFDENTSAANEERKEKAKQARKSVREEIGQITKAMRAQKAYDKTTIAGITKFAKEILKAGRVSELTTREVGRLLTLVNSTNGKSPASASRWATELLDYLLGHIVKDEQSAFMKIVNVKDRTVAQTGAEKQGKLDVLGQITVRAFRENMKSQLQTIQERLENLEERMESNDDAVRKAAQAEYDGLRLAMEYIEGIDANQEDEHQLQEELDQLKEAKSTGNLDKKSYEEYVKTTKEAIRESRMERIDMYRDMAGRLSNILSGSVDRAREFREREKQRVEDIHHDANRDMQGIPTREHRRETRWQKIVNSDVMRFFLKSYATFDQMCRFFGRKNATGEGYIYNRFFRVWQTCEDAKSRGIFTAHEELDKKASEVFGREMLWSDLYDIERGMPGMDVMFMDGGEMVPHTLTQGNMLYIYMADKMPDGRMKLRKMGITEDVVAKIKAALDPRFVKLADWLQGEYLVEKRNKYNAVHERMNGAPMADIENYFPLKILSSARHEEVDLGEGDNTGAMSSTVTGAVIKRRKNSLPLDLLHTDAFSLVIEHIDEMEDWAAFAEFRRDMNTLLSYKRFRNQVQNMTSTVYGGGEMLWDNFKAVASIATGNYKPKVGKGDLDRTALNIAKGVTGAKIAFRVNTAIKQLLSFPAYLPDARIDDLAKSMMTPGRSWNWCMENIPMFEKRWKSRKAGDTRLMDTDSDWDVWKEKVVETASRWGMTPNAFVDACTVAMGTKAMYETKKRLYIRDGYSEEEADRRAKQDAAVLFNQTQQSSEAGFVAPVQLDRTWLAVTFTTFRNSSMGYQRQLHDAIRTLGKVGGGVLNNRKYDDMIQFMARQRMEDGIDEKAAIAGAKRDYWRQFGRSAARIAVFGYGLQFLWSLGSNMWYLLLGDDDDEKEKLIKDAAINELAAPVEGMVAGDILAEIWSNLVAFVGSGDKWGLSNQNLGELPAVSDAKRVLREITNNQPAALSDLINLLAQVATGVNPSTFSDMVVAVIDACNGDLDTAKEAALLAMRVLQVPQSTIDEFIIDEIDMTNAEARKLSTEQLAKRYAHYKFLRNSPYTNWLYDDGEREKKHKSQEKAFKDKVKERMDLKEEELPRTLDEDYNDAVKPLQEFQRQLNRAKDDSDAVTVADLESRKEYREYKVWKKYQREINKLKKTIDETKDESLRERAKARRDELIRKMMSELSSVQ